MTKEETRIWSKIGTSEQWLGGKKFCRSSKIGGREQEIFYGCMKGQSEYETKERNTRHPLTLLTGEWRRRRAESKRGLTVE